MESTLTVEDLVFVKEMAKTGKKAPSAKKAYGVKDSKYANIKATRKMENAVIATAIEDERLSLKDALQNQGITKEKIAKKVDELLEGESYKSVDAGLRHATAIYGVQEETKPQNNNYTFIFNSETQEEIKKVEAIIKQKLLNHAPEN